MIEKILSKALLSSDRNPYFFKEYTNMYVELNKKKHFLLIKYTFTQKRTIACIKIQKLLYSISTSYVHF